jgi:PAS domain S-box-containing protein
VEATGASYALFAAVPLATCLICSGLAFAVLSRDPGDRTIRANALFMLAPTWWAFFEVLALIAPDAESAHLAYLLSTPGWVLVPPLALYVIGCVIDEDPDGPFFRITKLCGAISCGFIALNWTTHGLMIGVVKSPWGFSPILGPAYPAYIVYTMLAAPIGLLHWLRANPARASIGDEHFSWTVKVGFIAPMSIGFTTDAVLPYLDVQIPRLGSACFGILALSVLESTIRRGFMFATPGVFAQQILETLGEGVALVSPKGSILFANVGFERASGADVLRLAGAPVETFLPKPRLEMGRDFQGAESELISLSGERIPISLTSTTILDRQNNEVGIALSFRDIRDVKSLQRRLITSDRLAAVGQLAAGIAHEINNPIAFVRANLGTLREYWGVLEKGLEERTAREELAHLLAEGEEMIDESLEGIDRAAGIVRDVREFSHVGRQDFELADLNELMDRVIRVAAPGLGPGLSIEREYGVFPLVHCAPQQIEQVFLNLLVNAAHAVHSAESAGCVQVTTSADADEFRLRIDDDGCGIPEIVAERIFDPFFTTKEVGEGTGLGLSISYEIIRGHGGEIALEKKPEAGARFVVTLPLQREGDTSGCR